MTNEEIDKEEVSEWQNEILLSNAIDYNEMIDTETGKEVFWSKLHIENSGIEHNVEIIKLINLVYKIQKGKINE